MSTPPQDVYGGNYPKAKRLAFARSSGKCQFCGLQKAREAHHWAQPNKYPSGEKVQGHDLTALCKSCHELASMVRDWVLDKGANMDELEEDLNHCNTYIAKREAFSFWIYPEDEDEEEDEPVPIPRFPFNTGVQTPPKPKIETRGSIADQIHGRQAEIGYLTDVRKAIQRQMKRWENGESLESPAALKDAKEIAQGTGLLPNPTWHELNDEYTSIGRQMGIAIRDRESLYKQKKEGKGCGFYLALCVIAVFLYIIASPLWTGS